MQYNQIRFVAWVQNTNIRLHGNNQQFIEDAYVLLNLSNEFGKRDKCEACCAFYLFFFCNEFNKFNNTGERMLHSIYRMTIQLL